VENRGRIEKGQKGILQSEGIKRKSLGFWRQTNSRVEKGWGWEKEGKREKQVLGRGKHGFGHIKREVKKDRVKEKGWI